LDRAIATDGKELLIPEGIINQIADFLPLKLDLLEEVGKFGNILGAENEINVGYALQEMISLLLCDAPADPDNQLRVLALKPP
jgi:hypothetical protein